MENIHKCAECGEEVKVEGDVITRTCEHTEAAITADMEAVAYGKSSLE